MTAVIRPLLRSLNTVLIPALLLAAAWLAADWKIPRAVATLWAYAPFIFFILLGLLAIAYGRGRPLLAAIVLLCALLVQLDAGRSLIGWHPQGLSTLIVACFVPLNLCLIAWYEERGVFTWFGAMRLALVAVQLAILAGCAYFFEGWFATIHGLLVADWIDVNIASGLPQAGIAAFTVTAIVLLIATCIERTHLLFALTAGFFGYAISVSLPGLNLLHAMGIAIALMIAISILRDSYDMAYRDELTGLPQRRALNELFMSLSGKYAVAMIDVDHFKKFNDRHGHDVGDDVLKMVAMQIGKVRDGGRAFRYGGEEFTVVYPGKSREQALRSLELVRESIENYQIVIRSPRTNGDGKNRRGKGKAPGAKTVSVTISIGVADRQDRADNHEQVIKRADLSLYKAKKKGRNCVVTDAS